MPRISFAPSARETSLTARTTPSRVANSVTSRSISSTREPRVQLVPELVADQIDRQDRNQQRHARIHADPVLPREQELIAVGNQQAERGFGGGQSQAEERQRRLERDR